MNVFFQSQLSPNSNMKFFLWRDCIWLLYSQPSMVKVALEKSRMKHQFQQPIAKQDGFSKWIHFISNFFVFIVCNLMFLKIFLQKFAHENIVDSYLKILTLCSKCYFIASYLVLNFLKEKDQFHGSIFVPISTKECELQF